MKHYKVKVPIYTGKFHMFLYKDRTKMHKKFPDHKGFDAWCYKEDENKYVMVISKDAAISTIVHECVHIVNFIFGVHGVELDENNDEHQAYYMTWIFEQCEKFMKK